MNQNTYKPKYVINGDVYDSNLEFIIKATIVITKSVYKVHAINPGSPFATRKKYVIKNNHGGQEYYSF